MGTNSSLLKSAFALCLACALVACASTQDGSTGAGTDEASPEARYQVKQDAPQITELKNRNLAPGQCGMLLWTASGGSPILVFRNLDGQSAEMIIDGETTRMDLVEASGAKRYGVSTNQLFTIEPGTPGETRVSVEASFGIPFEGGNYVEEGIITLRNFFGWERVTPVAGLVGCRA